MKVELGGSNNIVAEARIAITRLCHFYVIARNASDEAIPRKSMNEERVLCLHDDQQKECRSLYRRDQ